VVLIEAWPKPRWPLAIRPKQRLNSF